MTLNLLFQENKNELKKSIIITYFDELFFSYNTTCDKSFQKSQIDINKLSSQEF